MNPEGTTFWGVVLKQALLGLSAFSVGLLMYRAVIFGKRSRPFLVTGYIGIAIILLIIGELIVQAPIIDPSWEAVGYLTGLAMIFVGFLGDAYNERRASRRRTQDKTE